jgi:hypothetical protein
MSKKANSGFCNMVFLEGIVQSVNWEYRVRGYMLLDVGLEKNKYIPCTVFGEECSELIEKISCFEKGDHMQVKGYLRPWSKKNDLDKWENHMDCRITEIKTKAPRQPRQSPQAVAQGAGWTGSGSGGMAIDDDIPF